MSFFPENENVGHIISLLTPCLAELTKAVLTGWSISSVEILKGSNLSVSNKDYLLEFQPQTGEGSTLDYSYLQSGQDGYTQYAQVGSGGCALTDRLL